MTGKQALIVSGANPPYFEWLRELVLSWRETGACDRADFGVMDLGLEAEQRGWLEEQGVHLARPDWPFADLEGNAPEWFKAMVCRPFLPEIFPGWDYVFWLDADSWIQNPAVLDLFIQGASREGFCAVPAVDRAYQPDYMGGKWFLDWQKSCLEGGFGAELAEKLYRYPIISAAAVCGKAAAPHWKVWQDYLEVALKRKIYREAEQTALCVMVHLGGMKTHFLPSWCHWVCNMGMPLLDLSSGQYVEPYAPYLAVGIMDMPGNMRSEEFILPTSGGPVRSTLRYGTAKRIAAEWRERKREDG